MIVYRNYETFWEDFIFYKTDPENLVTCFFCQKHGHIKYFCEPWRKQQRQSKQKDESSMVQASSTIVPNGTAENSEKCGYIN